MGILSGKKLFLLLPTAKQLEFRLLLMEEVHPPDLKQNISKASFPYGSELPELVSSPLLDPSEVSVMQLESEKEDEE
ncbi:hypothetical protein MUK42_33464 [Musa troglodytarum]|uniref:Uncharacterized protein n=1 Tax=Musa troglodytarum TaxID=320322 RepID=A0A9E7FE97_9LILI|nr:hypothetical protein MUK42_01877 [Musa troglodytarum]URD94344.1 hypothetical protein MUK42_33464 [Musa troglodytarum]